MAVAGAAAWYRYGQRMNDLYHSPYSIATGHTSLMFGEHKIWQLPVIARLAGRYLLYVIGPGSTLLFAFIFFRHRGPSQTKAHRLFAATCFLSVLIYLSVFTGGNYA